MLRFYILGLFLVGQSQVFAQNQGMPSGERWFQQATELAAKGESDSALVYFAKAIDHYEQAKDWKGAAAAYLETAKLLRGQDKNEEVVHFLKQSLARLEANNFKSDPTLSKNYIYLALSYKRLGKYAATLESYEKAIEVYESLQLDEPIVAYTYKNAALTCSRMLEYDKEKKLLMKAASLQNKGKYAASIHNAFVLLYTHSGKYDSAYVHYQKGLTQAKNSPYETIKQKDRDQRTYQYKLHRPAIV